MNFRDGRDRRDYRRWGQAGRGVRRTQDYLPIIPVMPIASDLLGVVAGLFPVVDEANLTVDDLPEPNGGGVSEARKPKSMAMETFSLWS